MITLKKPKLNIKYIGGKTKKYYKYNLTGLPKKKKLSKAKRVKSKKNYKEGYRIST